MKVIKYGINDFLEKWIHNVLCKECKSILEVEAEDIKYEIVSVNIEDINDYLEQYYCTCPVCNQKVIIDETYKNSTTWNNFATKLKVKKWEQYTPVYNRITNNIC